MPKLSMPFQHWTTYEGHSGIDYPYATGTPIRASGPGYVHHKNYTDRGGYQVWIKYDGYSKRVGHSHMNSYEGVPKDGTRVVEGTVIGYVGSLGANSTGPHLHSEIGGAPGSENYWEYFDQNNWVGKSDPAPMPKPEPEETEETEMIVNLTGKKSVRNGGAYVTKDGVSYFLGAAAKDAPVLDDAASGAFLVIFPRVN